MKIEPNVGKKIKKLPRTTRKAAVMLGQDDDIDLVVEFLAPFAEFEKNLYNKWFLKMSREVNDLRVDPETYAYTLVLKIREEKNPNLEKIVSLAKRRMEQQQQEGHRPSRVLGQIISIVGTAIAKADNFFEYALPYMVNLDLEGLKERVAVQEENFRRKDEDKLFLLQVLKHVRNLQDFERPIPLELLKIALQTEFSDNQKILQEQSLLIYHIYDSNCEKPLLVKQMCFDFIRVVLTQIIGNVTLINWLFLDDWISKETHDLLIDAHPLLEKQGMNSVVSIKVRKLYDKWHLERRKKDELTTPEKFVVDILELYGM